MAKINKFLIQIFALAFAGSALIAAEEAAFDAPDPAALKAYKQYWDAFAEYEQRKQKASIDEFERAKDGINAQYDVKEKQALEARVKLLQEGVEKYEKHLKSIPQASNRAYVMLNLSQMLAELSSLQAAASDASAGMSRQRALSLLKEIDDTFPDFEYKNDSQYQRALLLEAADQQQSALKIWQKLAKSSVSDRYALHANLASGDWEFEHGNPSSALAFYDRARTILTALPEENKSIDELRIEYRAGWAAYKATNISRALESAAKLLNPGVAGRAARQREKIVRDAVDLAGYSLFEMDDISNLKSTLQKPAFAKYGAGIILTAMKRYLEAGQNDQVSTLGKYANEKFGSDKEIPEILLLTSNAQKTLGLNRARIETLEHLAMLLPQRSLWRVKHQEDVALTKNMDDLATQAAITVASWHYENALASNAPRSFAHASGYYQMLIDKDPNGKESIGWRIKVGNSLLYGGRLKDAVKAYDEIISNLKVADENLSIAMYQKATAQERIWKSEMESSIQKGTDPLKNTLVLDALKNLESTIEDHANKFPNQSRSVDLLLVAASANRDQNRFEEASKFWQRSLLAQPTDVQRSMAVRGLVFAQLRAGKPRDVIVSVTKFLKLENPTTLSQNLRIELEGVLSSAASEESKNLSKNGQTEAGGALLIELAQEFKAIPNREQMYRDGAYMLAIGGNWPEAEQAAASYLKEGSTKFWGDMTYLTARSAEFQMRFPQAVAAYLSLAKKEPSHSRAVIARETAEKLAVADGNYEKAAEARMLSASARSNAEGRLTDLSQACEHFLQANNLEGALNAATRRRQLSQTDAEKMESAILLAQVQYAKDDKQNALDDMDTVAKQVERNRFKLGDKYASLAASANMFLAEDLRQKFQDFRLNEKADASRAVEQKSSIFAEMTSRYDKVASLDQKVLSPQARFLLASAASDFADELAGLPTRSGEPLTLKSQTRFQQNVSRLKDLSKKYHSNNILAKQRSPQVYANSEWIRKSAIALSAGGSDSLTETRDQVSSSIQMEVPQQWSH